MSPAPRRKRRAPRPLLGIAQRNGFRKTAELDNSAWKATDGPNERVPVTSQAVTHEMMANGTGVRSAVNIADLASWGERLAATYPARIADTMGMIMMIKT
jgi:hypothetical protein